MKWFLKKRPRISGLLLVFIISLGHWSNVGAQNPTELALVPPANRSGTTVGRNESPENSALKPSGLSPTLERYFDPLQGTSSSDLVRRALASNGELAAARIDIERARARRRQAGLRPNPTLDFEQTTGRFTGAAGETERSIGVALPIELGGQRRRRIELAEAELEAAEAAVSDRERTLSAEVRANYAEALAALRELAITENLNNLDQQTARFVQARVNEGETAPIELNLLMVEVDRLRSRRALVEVPNLSRQNSTHTLEL
jgi:outer membrane protein TolC